MRKLSDQSASHEQQVEQYVISGETLSRLLTVAQLRRFLARRNLRVWTMRERAEPRSAESCTRACSITKRGGGAAQGRMTASSRRFKQAHLV